MDLASMAFEQQDSGKQAEWKEYMNSACSTAVIHVTPALHPLGPYSTLRIRDALKDGYVMQGWKSVTWLADTLTHAHKHTQWSETALW